MRFCAHKIRVRNSNLRGKFLEGVPSKLPTDPRRVTPSRHPVALQFFVLRVGEIVQGKVKLRLFDGLPTDFGIEQKRSAGFAARINEHLFDAAAVAGGEVAGELADIRSSAHTQRMLHFIGQIIVQSASGNITGIEVGIADVETGDLANLPLVGHFKALHHGFFQVDDPVE